MFLQLLTALMISLHAGSALQGLNSEYSAQLEYRTSLSKSRNVRLLMTMMKMMM